MKEPKIYFMLYGIKGIVMLVKKKKGNIFLKNVIAMYLFPLLKKYKGKE